MRSITSRTISVVMLCLITSNSSCASSPLLLPPRLESRTLPLSTDFPGFKYQWTEEVCTRRFVGFCTQHEMKVHQDLYDLSDPAVRKQLHDMNFVAHVREPQDK